MKTPGTSFFIAEWRDAVFLHYAVPPEALQPFVPYPLDLHEGMAYVSLVAFTMKHLRPRRGGWLTALPFKPIATHEFLNVRTYVRHRGEPGIFFLAEWLPNLLSVLMGPTVFGLPYRWGRLSYQHDPTQGLNSRVEDLASDAVLHFTADAIPEAQLAASEPDTLTAFLLERYTAFTALGSLKRLFRVQHPPWQMTPLNVRVQEDSLLARTGDWHKAARFIGAHYAPGFADIGMSRPYLTSA